MKKCNNCLHKKNIPGDTHLQCSIVLKKMKEQEGELFFLYYSIHNHLEPESVKKIINKYTGMGAKHHGITSGWCNFPFNYDPIWLKGECMLHELKESIHNAY